LPRTPIKETSYPEQKLKRILNQDTHEETSYTGQKLKRLLTKDTHQTDLLRRTHIKETFITRTQNNSYPGHRLRDFLPGHLKETSYSAQSLKRLLNHDTI
jgi:hypothetical protein